MANLAVFADTTSKFGASVFVPIACTGSSTSSTAVSGGTTTAITVASATNFGAGQGVLIDTLVQVPAAPTLAHNAASTALGPGVVQVVVSLVNTNGEAYSASTSVTILSGDNVVITGPPTQSGVLGWYAYVTAVGGATYYRQQAVGAYTALGTNLTLTTIGVTGVTATPSQTNTAVGVNQENATILSVVGSVLTFTKPLAFTHTGTYTVIGGSCAVVYTCSTGGGADVVGRILLFNSHAVPVTFTLYKLFAGWALTDAGPSNTCFTCAWPTSSVLSYQNFVFSLELLSGQMLAWTCDQVGVMCTIQGIQNYTSTQIQPVG